jgi:DNA-binding NtrC family response regulator
MSEHSRILIIEPELIVAESLAEELRSHGHSVATANLNAQAINIALQIQPQLLIVEPRLEKGLAGIRIANTILSIYPKAEVILITSHVSQAELISLRKPCRVISKPFAAVELITTVEECLKH